MDVHHPDTARREQLLTWGCDYLGEASEDLTLRAASLAVEMRDHFWRERRRRGLRVSSWQVRLEAIAFVVACHRRRAEARASRERLN